jgi:hypothetical protein
MGNRIRYEKHPTKDECVVSIQDFVSSKNGGRYRIVLNLQEMTYHIRNERSKEFIYSSKKYGNLNVLKRTARAKLESYGITLSRESRLRTFGLCKKGFSQEEFERQNKESN